MTNWSKAQRVTERKRLISVDVIYARNLKPGDMYAGTVNPEAPTRVVQPNAAALELTEVGTFATDERTWVRMRARVFELTPVPASTQVLVIRGV